MSSSPREPTVSVVIPTHNRRPMLQRALASVAAQTWPIHEVIVVDDASTDGTADWIAQHAGSVRLVRHERARGGSASRNSGVDAATGEFIAFLDDDDEWLPRKIERQLASMQQRGCRAATCWSRFDFGYADVTFTVPPSPDLDTQLGHNVFGSATLCVVDASIAREVRFDETLSSAQDWDFWVRVSDRTCVAVVPEILARYIAHRGAKITRNPMSAYAGRRRFHLKHRRRFPASARRQGLGTLAYFRAQLPGSRRSQLHAIVNAARYLGPGGASLVARGLVRALLSSDVTDALVDRYVRVRTALRGSS